MDKRFSNLLVRIITKHEILGMNFNQTQSDFIPLSAQKVTLKVTFQEAARGGSRRVRVRLRFSPQIKFKARNLRHFLKLWPFF